MKFSRFWSQCPGFGGAFPPPLLCERFECWHKPSSSAQAAETVGSNFTLKASFSFWNWNLIVRWKTENPRANHNSKVCKCSFGGHFLESAQLAPNRQKILRWQQHFLPECTLWLSQGWAGHPHTLPEVRAEKSLDEEITSWQKPEWHTEGSGSFAQSSAQAQRGNSTKGTEIYQ